MKNFSHATRESVALAMDGKSQLAFDRLSLVSPRQEALGDGRTIIIPEAESLTKLSEEAVRRMSFFLRTSFIEDIASAFASQTASSYERLALGSLLENALCSAGGVLPLCQDTGTATAYVWKGERVLPQQDADLEAAIEHGMLRAWNKHLLRNSQVAPRGNSSQKLLLETNTGTNEPVYQEWFSCPGSAMHFLFVAKGGGSSNKTALYQETKRILEPARLAEFIDNAVRNLGVSACPPYTLALVLGGQGPEESVLAARLAATGALDGLPLDSSDGSPCRDSHLETLVLDSARRSAWGAQFGGRFMARAARVVRLSRHAASFPVALAISCSANRQLYARVDASGYYIERLASDSDIRNILATHRIGAGTHGIVDTGTASDGESIALADTAALEQVNLADGPSAWRNLKAGSMVRLSGTVVLARDAAHARIASMIEKNETLPDWSRYPVYYAGPTGTPQGYASGSLGPTTSKRMDSYLDSFMGRGIFPCSIGKGERSPACAQACAQHGGVYFAAVGGAAAIAAKRHVRSSRILDWEDLGMEAIRLVELVDLPVLVACDSEGNDYYERLSRQRT